MKNTILLVILFYTVPLFSQEWVRQYPFEGFAPLQAITFDETGDGWSVGSKGIVLHTNNWGSLWKVVNQEIFDDNDFESVEIIPGTNGQKVLIGGQGVYYSLDHGDNWAKMDIDNDVNGVYRIQAYDAYHYVVLGTTKGARTTDGGQNWTVFDMPDNNANAAFFIDLQNGWAGSGPFDGQQLYKTTNGGTTWELADDDTYPLITDIAMINAQAGFLSGRDFMYKTNDGGASWTKMHVDAQPSLTRMFVVNEQIICSGLNNGFIFYTSNGGVTWQQINPNLINSNKINDVYATADGRIWAPGKYASIQYSANNGAVWSDQTPGVKKSLFDVDFIGDVGWAAGSEGLLLHTTNNGAIWNNVSFDEAQSFFAVSMIQENGFTSVVVGSTSGNVYYSFNNGWQLIGQGLGQIRSIDAVDRNHIVVATETAIQYTSDGGQSWHQSNAQLQNIATEIQMVDEQTGYVATHEGKILKTIDGGQTWNPCLVRSNNYQFSGIHFNDAANGWAVAELQDSVWVTNNGGDKWGSYKLPTNTFWQDIQFMDQDTGYISGGGSGSGIILRTIDGGQSWKVAYREIERLNNCYVRPGEDAAWVVGFGGNILHYSPCSITPDISNLSGEIEPCEGNHVFYEIDSKGVTLFEWTVPPGWTILGNTNTGRIEVLVGKGSGDITARGANTCGDNTNLQSLSVSSLPTSEVVIEASNGTLSTDLSDVSYQWLLNGVEIPGANQASFIPDTSGTYSLEVTFTNGCTRVSNELLVEINAVADPIYHSRAIYPNPVSQVLYIDRFMLEEILSIRIINANGQQVKCEIVNTNQINVRSFSPGLYSIYFITTQGNYLSKFIKQ